MQNNTFSTLFLGQNLIKLLNVDSTNNYLKKQTSNSEPLAEGTVILAEHQFAGRGQRASTWQAEPGKNLTFSLYLTPTFLSPLAQFSLSVAVSVALQAVLQGFAREKVSIKWPNDIFIGDKKVAGILIENTIAGKQLKHAIIGIGVNVNQDQFPDKLNGTAVSLKQILHENVNREKLLHEICKQLEVDYLALKEDLTSDLQSRYLKNLYRINERASFRTDGNVFEGVIKGVTPNGCLKIRTLDHEELEFGIKEIEFL